MNNKSFFILTLLFIATNINASNIIFENLGTKLSKKDSSKIDIIIKHEQMFYAELCNIDSIHIKLNIFTDKTAYALYSRGKGYPADKYTGGVYFSKTKECIVLKKNEDDYLPIVYHEISHYFTHLFYDKCPRWLNEGLAEYFEQCTIKKKEIKHEMTEYEIGRIKTMIQIDDINFSEFFSWTNSEFMKKQSTDDMYAYILSHGIVYFLLEKDKNIFKDILLCIKSGHKGDEAIDKFYPGGFTAFNKDFRKYYLEQ